ncbi:hypothetical protein [Herbiconiux sp. L3-i23]|uniref:hypothetical protein n=1 Tax=Herbiconiux sp. L3-i23 TaxID=2905871 RepID=UPI00205699A7|nr:hypothetical protein [Herbiconiux sp. L3-i23]BDI21642.1 hypothetical protein L3i23_04180 [Herbiconiux sp. L3-i23]
MTADRTAPARRLLVASSVRWDYLWQRHHALTVAAAEAGWQVDFLPPHPRNAAHLMSGLRGALGRDAETPSLAPPTPDGVRLLPMSAWLKRPVDYDMVLAYIPDRWTEWYVARTGAPVVVYDAVLDWATVPATWYPPIGWRSAERRISASASAVITDADGMRRTLQQRGIDATVVPPAADAPFETAVDEAPAPRSAIYFGAVRAETDITVMTALAANGVTVEVVGVVDSTEDRAALEAAGIPVHPPVDVATLASLVARHEFVLLPYRGSRSATLAPAKTWNALASGRWVIASGLDLGIDAPNLVQLPEGADAAVAAVLERTGTAPATGGTAPTWAERWRTVETLAGAR